MLTKQNPFSFYDFLGYFIPGSFFIYIFVLAYGHATNHAHPFEPLMDNLIFEQPELWLPFILTSYVAGHLLSYLSSVTIEKYAIWMYDYPSKYLLGIGSLKFFDIKKSVKLRKFIRLFVLLIIFPISFFDLILGRFLKMNELYTQSLDSLLITSLRGKIANLIINEAEVEDPDRLGTPNEHNFFLFAYHYAVENSPSHAAKMQNYVALYGFSRTITLIFILISWVVYFHVVTVKIYGLKAILLLVFTASISYVFFRLCSISCG